MVEFEKRSDPCAHTSQPIEYKLTCHIRQKSQNVHSKVSHSKPFYPNNFMSLECLDASLEIPIHGVQESLFQE